MLEQHDLAGGGLGCLVEIVCCHDVSALVVTVIGLVVRHCSFLGLAFNRDKAEALGLRLGRARAALLTLLGVAVVSGLGCPDRQAHAGDNGCCGAVGWSSVVLGLISIRERAPTR